MNLCIEMFDLPRARRTDPSTSHAAAQRASAFASSHSGRILEVLKVHGWSAALDIAQISGLTVVQVDRRLPEMASKGLARVVLLSDGTPHTRYGMRVWKAL